jgi:hypothetical protein
MTVLDCESIDSIYSSLEHPRFKRGCSCSRFQVVLSLRGGAL